MPTTWNPSDKSTNVALSAGNHTATSTAGAGNEGGRSTSSKTAAGKWYAEFTGIADGGNSFGLGLGSGSETITSNGVPAFRIRDGGGITVPNSSTYTGLGSDPSGKTVSMAVDLDASPPRGWFRYDAGSWFGNAGTGADPTVPSTGYDLTSLVFPTFLKFFLQFSAHTVTLNAGDSAFLQSMPAGYQAWDSVPPPAFSRAIFVGA